MSTIKLGLLASAAMLLVSCGAPTLAAPTAPMSPSRLASPIAVSSPLATAMQTSDTSSASAGGITCEYADSDEARTIAERVVAADSALTATASGALAFAVHDHANDVTCSWHGTQHFASASTIKVATVAAYLWQAEQTGNRFTDHDRALAEAAIVWSDNDAQAELWLLVGGGDQMSRFFEAAGMANTLVSPDDDWGLTSVTASDQLTLLLRLTDGTLLNEPNSRYLLGLMTRIEDEQVWGVSTGAPAGSEVALKNGWLDTAVNPAEVDEWGNNWGEVTWTNNSIGHVRSSETSYSMAILSAGNVTDEAGRERVSAVAGVLAEALQG